MNRLRALSLSAWVGILLSVLVFELVPAWGHEGHDNAPTSTSDPNAPKHLSDATAALIGVKTAEVDFGKLEDVITLTGTVTALPDQTQAVASRTGGIVRAVKVQPGDVVKKGELLATIDSPELARNWYEVRKLEAEYSKVLTEVKRAEASSRSLAIELPAAKRTAEFVEAEVDRLEKSGDAVAVNVLNERRSVAIKLRTDASLKEVDFMQSKQEVESLKRQAESVQRSAVALRAVISPSTPNSAQVVDAGSEPGLLQLFAQIDGVVTSRSAVLGDGIEAGRPLLMIGNYAQVQIEGEIPESLVDRFQGLAGLAVRIRKTAGGPVISTGKMLFISPEVDPTSRTAHVIVVAENLNQALRQNAFVELSVVIKQLSNVVVVPASAVLGDGPVRYVFIVERGVFLRREINTGSRDDQLIEVKDGLVPGDTVVVQGAYSLSKVRGSEAAAAKTPSDKSHGTPIDSATHTH